MADIDVTETSPGEFKVVVVDNVTTEHVVTGADEAEVVRKSFEFLLEREPNTSILSKFDLEVIGKYFPEYWDERAKW